MRFLPLRLAIARLKRNFGFATTCSAAVALSLIALMTLQGISSSRTSALINYSLSALSPGDRTLTVSTGRLISSESEFSATQAFLDEATSKIISKKLISETLYHELADSHGSAFYLGGTDDLSDNILLTKGRLPKKCSQSECEVVQIGPSTKSVLQLAKYGLTIVGQGNLRNTYLFSGTFSTDKGIPLLLASGTETLSQVAQLSTLQGANGWIAAIDSKKITAMGVTPFEDAIISMENRAALKFPNLNISWPEDSIADATSSAEAIEAKIGTISHGVLSLLLAFLILISLRKKESHQQFRSGLSRIGTPRSVLSKELILEYSIPIFLASVISVALSPIVKVILDAFGFHSGMSGLYHHWPIYPFLLFTCASVVTGCTLWGDRSWTLRVWIPFLLAAIFSSIFLLLDAQTDDQDWRVPAIGALCTIGIALVVTKVISTWWRGINRTTFFTMREDMLMWQSAAAILAFTIFLASLTISFNSGANKEINMQARNSIPLNLLVSSSDQLVNPLDLGGERDFEKILAGTHAFPVLRIASSVRGKSAVSDSISLLGINPDALLTSSGPEKKFIKAISPRAKISEPHVALGSATTLSIETINIPPQIEIAAWISTPTGKHESLLFKGKGANRSLVLPMNLRKGSSLVAFELHETSDYLSRRLHALGEGRFQVPAIKGVGSISKIKVDKKLLDLPAEKWGTESFNYSFDGDSLYLRPEWKSELPGVIADPKTAALAEGGILTVSGLKNSAFRVRVVATQEFFPSAGDAYIVMDLDSLRSHLAFQNPGSIDPLEIWISTPNEAKYLRNYSTSNLANLNIKSQQKLTSYLRSDPYNTGIEGAYITALALSLILALILLISVLPLVRKEKSNLFFLLEARGRTPRELRLGLLRAFRTTVITGVIVGLCVGLATMQLTSEISKPFKNSILMVIAAVAISELGSRLFLRTVFTETSLIEEKK